MAVGKSRGQRPARAGSADFSMRSIERRKALHEGYPTSDREKPRTAKEMGTAIGFSGDDADVEKIVKPIVTSPPRLPARLQEEIDKSMAEHTAASADDAAAIAAANEMRRKLGVKRGTPGSSDYE